MSTVLTDLGRRAPAISWRARADYAKQAIGNALLVGATLLSEMPFLEHLEELRSRLIKCLIALAVTTAICLTYTAEIIAFLIRPAATSGIPIVAIEATEVFSV